MAQVVRLRFAPYSVVDVLDDDVDLSGPGYAETGNLVVERVEGERDAVAAELATEYTPSNYIDQWWTTI